MNILYLILAVSIISGCASSGVRIPTISHEEAAAFEKSSYVPKSKDDTSGMIYNQPVNKKEGCKLPTSNNQLQRRNFKQYWDGECKDGYAFGLGRDISISDTHHYAEITIHNGTGKYFEQPVIFYDFVNNFVKYSFRGGSNFSEISLNEEYNIANHELIVTHKIIRTDKNGNTLLFMSSPLVPKKYHVNVSNGVAFHFLDQTAMPLKHDDVAVTMEIKNSKGIQGGVAIVKFKNGQVRHVKIESSGQKSLVQIPESYITHILSKYQEIQNAIPEMNRYIEFAKRTEREYMHLACNGTHEIEGLDNKTATKICNWRNELQPMYLAAIERAKKQMEQQLHAVEKAENERMQKEKIAQQQAAIEQQQRQQAWNEINNSLNNLSNSLQNSAMRTQQMMQSMPVYQPQPIQPIGSSGRINCITTGPLTSCR